MRIGHAPIPARVNPAATRPVHLAMAPTARPHSRRFALSLLAALALQFPLAWGIVYFSSPHWQGETSVIIDKPPGNSSNVDRVRIENDTQTGVRWVRISGWSAAYDASVCRSDEEQLFIDEPTWPFAAADVLPGLRDPGRWPPSVPGRSSFAAGGYGETFVEAYAIGWPFLCLTGRADRDPMTGKWPRTTGVIIAPEPKFRTWSTLGCVPLCYVPRWQGCIGNTIALGLPIFALWTGLAALRLARRRRRGMCIQCCYDLRATPAGSPCPECGATPPTR
jgi:hypothetical protein